ncbi:hypothetical protein ACRYSL_22345 (plasmid) [Enterobacter mori]|uniref:hypothetical protein n=1 Tax=Enterobacter mori TaxID=539813 RepID=UPI003F61266F
MFSLFIKNTEKHHILPKKIVHEAVKERRLQAHRQSDGSLNYTDSLITRRFPLSAFSGKAVPAGPSGTQALYIALRSALSRFIQAKRILSGSFSDLYGKLYDSFLWYISRKRKSPAKASAGFFRGFRYHSRRK